MKSGEFSALSLAELEALAIDWTRAGDDRAPVLRAYLDAVRTHHGNEPELALYETRSGVFSLGVISSDTFERYRKEVERRAFGLGEDTNVEVSWVRGSAVHVAVFLTKGTPSLEELSRVLRHPSGRLLGSVGIHVKDISPEEMHGLATVRDLLRERVVTPRVWTGPLTPWIEVFATFPRLRVRLAGADDPSFAVLRVLGNEGHVPAEVAVTIDDIVRGLRYDESVEELVEKRGSVLVSLAERGARLQITADGLDLDEAGLLLEMLPDAFGGGHGVVGTNERGFQMLTTGIGYVRATNEHALALRTDEHLAVAGSPWNPTRDGDFFDARLTTHLHWIPRDISRYVTRYLAESS